MGLSKLSSQVNIKSDGNLFYELFRYKQHHFAQISPETVEKVDLLSGQWGTAGSIIRWHYFMDGEKKWSKEIIESIDEETKSITYIVLDGDLDLMKLYNTFKFTINVIDTNCGDTTVKWTFEYEKKNERVPDPHTLMTMSIDLTKEVERHHLLIPN